MGISPDIWGPSAWVFLHLMALSEPDDRFDRSRLVFYKQFYHLLQNLLPCDKCKNHLKENLQKLKDIESIQTKRELFDWTTQLHNLVNKANGTREYSLDESYTIWNEIASGKKQTVAINYWIFGIIFMLLVIIALVLLFHKK